VPLSFLFLTLFTTNNRYSKTHGSRPVRVVVGMSSDKDLKLCGDILLQNVEAGSVHLVEASHPRAATVGMILEEADGRFKEEAHYDVDDPSITKQVNNALKMAGEVSERSERTY